MMRVLANVLTASRVVIALAIFLDPSLAGSLMPVIWAAMSDFGDGWLARRSKTLAASGATFDLTADGLFFFACFLGFVRIGALPVAWFAALLVAVIPELVAQAVFLVRRTRIGSPGRAWNKVLGGYSYCCVAGLALGGDAAVLVAPLVLLQLCANSLDLWTAVRSGRASTSAPGCQQVPF